MIINIDERKIDKIIANEIMGWTWDDETAISPTGSASSRIESPNPWWWLPRYSSDIVAAWEVVEKLTNKNGRIIGQFNLLKWGVWTAYFSYVKTGGGQFDFSGSGPNAPCAICEAACKILNGKEMSVSIPDMFS